jgi:Fur family peroxide stress response transcriptional regulator
MPIVRRSRKRDAMLELMRSTKCHPSADWVYRNIREQYPDVSLGTVYRNLNQLTEEGFIKSVGVVKGQERFDARMEPHSHFVCNHCGAVIDLPNCVSEEILAPLGEEYGFVEQSYELHIYGLCKSCTEKKVI